MAEDELIEIVPNMRMDPLNFICVIFKSVCPIPFLKIIWVICF